MIFEIKKNYKDVKKRYPKWTNPPINKATEISMKEI